MDKYLIVLIVIMSVLFSCSKYKGEKNSMDYDIVNVVFDGYDEYDVEGKLKIEIKDPDKVKKLNQLKNQSKIQWLAFHQKPTKYSMRLVFIDTLKNEKLLMTINYSGNWYPQIRFGNGTMFNAIRKNRKFIEYLGSIIHLEEIRKYKGALTQKEYDKLIRKKRE